ncbi:MAG: S8 family serine peptidase, partial [Candidatus Nanopelagicales bacterium]
PGNYTGRAYDDSLGGTQLATCTSLSTSCTLDELDPATTYWIDVTASNHIGDSPASAPRISASPGAAEVPGAPQTVQARTSSQQVRLSWTAPASDGGSAVTGYTAELYSSPSGGAPVQSCSTAGLTCTITGLTNAVTYYASVVATNDVGPGAGSTRFAVTPRAEYQPDDPYYTSNQMWGLSGEWGINAPSAWAMTQGSPDVVVAVLDTGGTDHPDLLDQTVAGYDMIESLSTANDGDGRDPNPADPGDWSSSRSSSWHGTHVAGTINAIGNNATGVVGVAPEVKVQHVRVLGTGGGWTSDIAAGITWASGGLVSGLPLNATPARVINMSLGGSGSCGTAMQTAINGARTAGTAVVVAAG